MAITVSNPNNITSPIGNALAIFKDSSTNNFFVVDINGKTESLERALGQENLQEVLDIGNSALQDMTVNGKITFGQSNTNSGTRSFIAGNSNTVSGIENQTLGLANTNSSEYGVVIGSNNSLSGATSVSVLIGEDNIASNQEVYIIGNSNNAEDNSNIYFFGTNIEAGTNTSCFALGQNLDQFNSDDFQLHLGEFSLDETKAGYLQKITVGVGRDASNKENGLVIWKETSSPFSNLFDVTGKLLLNNYGSGNITGTATYRLGVDVNGNVIEVSDGGGTVTAIATTLPITGGTITTSGTIGINQATTSSDGYLSSTDWNTFNNKQSALTFGDLTETTSNILTITDGTNAVIGSGTTIAVAQANASTSGFLSSTDWNTFNNKISGSGTSNTIAMFNSLGVIGNSQITDDGADINISSNRNFNSTRNFGSNEFNAKIDVGGGLGANLLALDVRQKAFVRAGMVISPNPTGVQVDNSSLVVGSGANDIVSGSDHCLAVGSGNQILLDSDRSVSFGNNNETKQSDNSINVGNANVLRYSNNSHIIGQNNQIGDDYLSGTSGFNNSIVFGSDNLLLTDNGSPNPPNGALSFVIGHDNDLRHTLQNSFSFGYSISNLGGSATSHRNDFNIGGDLVAVNETMTLGYRNDPTLYPTIDRNNGLGETKFVVSVGSATTTNANALLITEGGVSGGGGGTVPQIPRIILPTIVNFNYTNDTNAGANGIPIGGLYHTSGTLKIRLT